MPPSLKLSYNNLKSQSKGPIWHFSGTFLIILGIAAIAVSEKKKGEKVTRYIQSPKVNDVFEVKLKDNEYTLYKVQKVVGDTVYFVANKYQTNQETGLSDLTGKEYDMTEQYGLPKSKLQEMNNNDEIIDIDRN